MAVRKIGQTERYVGLSGDAKPTPSLAHAIFYEIDTGKEYKWDGANWQEQIQKFEGKAQLTGSSIDLRGLATNRPDADDVDIGTTYWAVDTGDIHVSDGTNWVVV